MKSEPLLEAARRELAGAQARLERLKRGALDERRRARPDWARGWLELRLALEGLRELLGGWEPRLEAEDGPDDPAWRARRDEIEELSARARESLERIDRRQRELDEERASAVVELERAQEAWRVLRQDAHPIELGEGTLAALVGKAQAVTAVWEGLLEQNARALRERDRAESLWRWLLSVSVPALEDRAGAADSTLTLPTLRRLLESIEERRLAVQAQLHGDETGAALFEKLERSRRQLEAAAAEREALRADFERLLAQTRVDYHAEISKLEDSYSAQLASIKAEAQAALDKAGAEFAGREAARDAELEARAQREAALEKRHAEDAAALSSFEERRARELAEIDWRRAKERAEIERRAAAELAELRERFAATLEGAAARAARLERQAEGLAGKHETARRNADAWRSVAEQAHAELLQAGEQALRLRAGRAPAPAEAQDAPPALPEESETPREPSWSRVFSILEQRLTAALSRLSEAAAGEAEEPSGPSFAAGVSAVAEAADAARFVREFLDEDLALEGPAPAEQSLSTVLSLWEPSLRLKRITLTRLIEPPLPPVRSRGSSLRTAYYQLVRNAFEAMPSGGKLTVTLRHDPDSDCVVAEFLDTGPGLSAGARKTLFDPFVTSKPGHLGLGLALARRIALRCGGTLEAPAREGGGALLRISFPAGPSS